MKVGIKIWSNGITLKKISYEKENHLKARESSSKIFPVKAEVEALCEKRKEIVCTIYGEMTMDQVGTM